MDNPSVQHIAIALDDGVAVMQFITQTDAGDVREASEAAIEAELARSGFAGKPWAKVNHEDIPTDRASRARWRLRDGKIVVEAP